MSLVTRGLGSPALVTKGFAGSTVPYSGTIYYNEVYDVATAVDQALSTLEAQSAAFDSATLSDSATGAVELSTEVFDYGTVLDGTLGSLEFVVEVQDQAQAEDSADSVFEFQSEAYDTATVEDGALANIEANVEVYDDALVFDVALSSVELENEVFDQATLVVSAFVIVQQFFRANWDPPPGQQYGGADPIPPAFREAARAGGSVEADVVPPALTAEAQSVSTPRPSPRTAGSAESKQKIRVSVGFIPGSVRRVYVPDVHGSVSTSQRRAPAASASLQFVVRPAPLPSGSASHDARPPAVVPASSGASTPRPLPFPAGEVPGDVPPDAPTGSADED